MMTRYGFDLTLTKHIRQYPRNRRVARAKGFRGQPSKESRDERNAVWFVNKSSLARRSWTCCGQHLACRRGQEDVAPSQAKPSLREKKKGESSSRLASSS